MLTVEKTVWLIENRFREHLSLDDLAEASGLSKFHISRMFTLATGSTISAYLRGRRLSEAAKSLAAGAPDILSVALDAGYNSHEAFTRAFRDQFGMTPEQVRKARTTEKLLLMEPLRMKTNLKTKLAPPAIETIEKMTLVGIRKKYSGATLAGIPDQWQQFQPYLSIIPAASGEFFTLGVIMEPADGDPDGFDYMCAVKDPGVDLLAGMERLEVPSLCVAKFTHTGHIATINDTCAEIFAHGLAAAGLTTAGPISFFEVYGPDFDTATGLGTVGLWMNVID